MVGGGIAGLEAARVAAKRGYDVTVYEASDHLAPDCAGGRASAQGRDHALGRVLREDSAWPGREG